MEFPRADELVRNYDWFKEKITLLLDPQDEEFAEKARGLSVFPILVHLGDGEICLAHHMQFGVTNSITRKPSPSSLMFGVQNGCIPKDFKGFDKEICGKGEQFCADKFVRLIDHPEEVPMIGL